MDGITKKLPKVHSNHADEDGEESNDQIAAWLDSVSVAPTTNPWPRSIQKPVWICVSVMVTARLDGNVED
jgi:hypothetical protein